MRVAKFGLLLIAALGIGKGATIQLYQGGWDVGGPLVITFTGEDTNADSGYETAELTSFSALFQLPGGGQATISLADIVDQEFFYASPTDYFISIESPDIGFYQTADMTGSIGIATGAAQSFFSLTEDALRPVPEPTSAALLAVGLVIVSAWMFVARPLADARGPVQTD